MAGEDALASPGKDAAVGRETLLDDGMLSRFLE